jgi:hypothetical protein
VLAFPVPHETHDEVVGVVVVLHAGRITSLDELRRFARPTLAPRHLPALVAFMATVPAGERGAPVRAGLASRLGLPVLTDEGDEATTWDVGSAEPGEADAMRARPVAHAHKEQLDQFLSDEERPATASGGAVELSLGGLRGTMMAYLRAALLDELSQMRMLDTGSELTADTALVTLGLESLSAANLRQRIYAKLGCEVPREDRTSPPLAPPPRSPPLLPGH